MSEFISSSEEIRPRDNHVEPMINDLDVSSLAVAFFQCISEPNLLRRAHSTDSKKLLSSALTEDYNPAFDDEPTHCNASSLGKRIIKQDQQFHDTPNLELDRSRSSLDGPAFKSKHGGKFTKDNSERRSKGIPIPYSAFTMTIEWAKLNKPHFLDMVPISSEVEEHDRQILSNTPLKTEETISVRSPVTASDDESPAQVIQTWKRREMIWGPAPSPNPSASSVTVTNNVRPLSCESNSAIVVIEGSKQEFSKPSKMLLSPLDFIPEYSQKSLSETLSAFYYEISAAQPGHVLNLREYHRIRVHLLGTNAPLLQSLHVCLNMMLLCPRVKEAWHIGRDLVDERLKDTPAFFFAENGQPLSQVTLRGNSVDSQSTWIDQDGGIIRKRKIDSIKKTSPKDLDGDFLHYSMRHPMYGKNKSTGARYINPRCDLGEKHIWSLVIVFFSKKLVNLQPHEMTSNEHKIASYLSESMRADIRGYDHVQDREDNKKFKRLLFEYLTGMHPDILSKNVQTEMRKQIEARDHGQPTNPRKEIKKGFEPEDLFSVKEFIYRNALKYLVERSNTFRYKLIWCLESAEFNQLLKDNTIESVKKLFDKSNCKEYPYTDLQNEQAVDDFKRFLGLKTSKK